MRFQLRSLFRGAAELVYDTVQQTYAAIPRNANGAAIVAAMNGRWSELRSTLRAA